MFSRLSNIFPSLVTIAKTVTLIFLSELSKGHFCNKKKPMTDQDLAFILYKDDVPQKDIAKAFGKSEQTILRWKKEGDWERKRTEQELAKHSAQEDAQELLNYQLRALKKIKQQYEKEGGTQLIAKGDIDGIRDLFNCVKGKQIEWTILVKTVRRINRFLKDTYPALAVQVAQPFDEFLLSEKKQAS